MRNAPRPFFEDKPLTFGLAKTAEMDEVRSGALLSAAAILAARRIAACEGKNSPALQSAIGGCHRKEFWQGLTRGGQLSSEVRKMEWTAKKRPEPFGPGRVPD
jgi:hypothetical protein